MLLALVAVVAVGGVVTLIYFVVLAMTSARCLQRTLAGTRAQVMPAVDELLTTARGIAERAQHLRPQP